MDETEAHLSQAAIISPSSVSIKSSNELDLKFKTEEGSESSDLIPFPSPSLDNDFFHVKQLDKRLMNNDEDDMLEYKEETFEIEHEVRIVSEPEPKSPVLDTDSPRQRSTSLKLEVNDECSENGSLKNSMLSPFNRSIDSRDGLLKFDSDMDNSFKRQSISARYLMKTQLQKQQSEQKSPPIKAEPVKASLELSSSIDVIAPVKINSTATSAQFGLNSTAQIAADMLKIRRKSSVLNAIPHSSTSPSISSLGSSSNLATQQLYNHHTESSLNKTKTKSTSNEASSSSKSNHLSVVGASGMKRSPSVNSLNESSNKTKTEPKAKTTPAKQQNLANKHSLNVPGKTNANGNNSTDSDESSNLKKAVSMLSLYSKNQTSTNQRHGSTSGSPKHTNSTPNSSSSSITAGSTLLPPKTVRQIKQRSAERQLTSSIITISSNRPSLASTPTTQTNPIETFTEQSKHLRKLSNSVQNLAQASNLPPQPPRSPSKSPQLDTCKNEPIRKSKKASTQELKVKRVAETITSAKMSELLIIDQIKRLDSDQMSSSSSHNGDYIESNQLDNDDNPNHQSNQFQTSSNSLTSSSSSSCSLFENMNQGSSINNDIHIETSSNLNQTLTKLDELGSSNENKLNKNELKLNLNKSADLSRPTELDFNSPTSNSHLYNSSNSSVNSNNISSMMSSNYNGLKKPITFAAIAAANSPNAINVCSLTSSTNAKNGNQLTNDKIESILNEFKQNIYLLDLIYNQVNAICFIFLRL
jgi:hypothetical protein